MQTIQEAIDATSVFMRRLHGATMDMNEAADKVASLKGKITSKRAREMDKWLGKTSVAETERRADIAVADLEEELIAAIKDHKALVVLREVWQEGVWSGRKAQESMIEEMRMTR